MTIVVISLVTLVVILVITPNSNTKEMVRIIQLLLVIY